MSRIQLDTKSPGFRHFILKPLPGGTLTWAEGSYHSICGKIEVKWKKEEDKFSYVVVIPANTTATVYMPAEDNTRIWVDGEKLSDLNVIGDVRFEEGYVVFELESGNYRLSSNFNHELH